MEIETQRLLIRDVKTEDKIPFVQMAADGSLNDCGFDRDCGNWITKWIDETRGFAFRDNPNTDYLAYTITLKAEAAVIGSIGCSYYEDLRETGITYFIGAQYRDNGYAVEAVKAYTDYYLNHYKAKRIIATVRDENISSWKVIEKVGFILNEKRMYKDLNDDDEKLYRFYEITKNRDNGWLTGRLFFNREDKRVIIKRPRSGFGYTMNLGNKWTWIFCIIFVIIIVILVSAL